MDLIADNGPCTTDSNNLVNAIMYCNDAGSACSWIDHILCSPTIDQIVCNVSVLEEYITSDHKPLAITVNNLVRDAAPSSNITISFSV